ncbi:MAG TPA: hypothetical protein VGH70_04580 [Bradyrhizobium sp.]
MTWTRRFDTPIDAAGRTLATLRDAGDYILTLPKATRALPHWQLAAQLLLAAAEQGGIVMMADIAMRQALARDRPKPAPDT